MQGIEHVDWVETFVAVVDHGGFSAAAEVVHRSQSRVSAHVASLERALGARLFDRRHRPVALTDAGEAFLVHARAVLVHLERGQADVDAVLGLTRGHVSLGSYPSASAAFVPALLGSFRERYPGVHVDLVEQRTLALEDSLATGDVELALRPSMPEPRPGEGLRGRPLWREWLVAVLPAGDPLSHLDAPAPLAALAERPIITIGRGRPDAPVRYETQEAFHRAGLEPWIAWQTDQPQTLASLVRAGLGVGVTNQLSAEVSDTTSLAIIRLGRLGDGREVSVFWDQQRHQSVACRALLREILSTPLPPGAIPIDGNDSTQTS